MNKKVLIGIVGVLFLCCLVCAAVLVFAGTFYQKTENGREFNNNIINENNEFQRDLQALGTEFSSLESTEESVNEMREDLIVKANDSIDYIEDLDVPDGGDDLKKLSIEIFNYYIDILENEYVEAINLQYSEDYSTEDYERIQEIAAEVQAQEAEYSKELEEVQKKLADKYNFTLEYDQ